MDWCPVCCSRHESRRHCPGELLATGPERHGTRLTVTTATMREVYGVLIAEAGRVWRARIVTYPNMLWSVPGGRGTMKFVGETPQAAQQEALDYIRRHCAHRGLKVVEVVADVEESSVDPEAAAGGSPSGAQDDRLPHALSVQFGETKTRYSGRTADLSYGGLFIDTDHLFDRGRRLKLSLQLDQFSIPLVGVVAWNREVRAGGKRRGMGIQLENPPAMYVRYVEKITQDGAEEDPAQAAG